MQKSENRVLNNPIVQHKGFLSLGIPFPTAVPTNLHTYNSYSYSYSYSCTPRANLGGYPTNQMQIMHLYVNINYN